MVLPLEIEPLEPNLWFAELGKLQARRRSTAGEPHDALFRTALYLLQLTPLPLREFIACRVHEATIESLLDCGAYMAAAVALFGHPTGMTLVRDNAAEFTRVTVVLSGTGCVGEDADPEPAMAFMGAWLLAVLSLGHSDERVATTRSDALSHPFGSKPSVTRH